MDLARQFPCVYPMQAFGKAKSANLFMLEIADALSLSRTSFNGHKRICYQEIASSSMGRSKRGFVCCKKSSSNEGSSKMSKWKQEEIISLFRRIQSSISKEESAEGVVEEKNSNGSPKNVTLSKAILNTLEKPRNKPEGDTSKKGPPAQPPSSLAKQPPFQPSTLGSRGKLPVSKSDIASEETTEKDEKAPLIETMKLAELKEVAKNIGIKGYSKLKKSELLALIKSY